MTDERGFYLAAASTAFARFKVHELQASLRNRSLERVALGLPGWFGELFPEYAIERGEERKVVAQAAEASAREAEGTAGGRSPPASRGDGPHPFAGKAAPSTGPNASSGQHPPVGVPYKDSLLFAECPYCGAYTPFEFRDRSELTVIMFDGQAVPTKDTVAPEGSFRRVRACVNPECKKEFWLWVAGADGAPRAETKRKEEKGWYSMPSRAAVVGSVRGCVGWGRWVFCITVAGGWLFLFGVGGRFVPVGSEGI